MRISDWSSDVCSSDLPLAAGFQPRRRQLGRRMADIDPNSAKAKDIDVLMEQARKAGDLLKALSHESRLMILCILAEGEKSVSESEALLRMPQAEVSTTPDRTRFERLGQTTRGRGRASG